MRDVTEHPLYDHILKLVLWGEDKDKVYRSLTANKITGREADELYGHAMATRIRIIRSDNTKKALVGLLMIAGGTILFAIFWFGLGLVPRGVTAATCAILVFGLWKFGSGLASALFAANKEGPIDED